jgi:hypothetical protein
MADEIDQDQDVTQDLQDLHKEYETIVASLTACIKGLKTLRKTATAATTTDVRIRKGGVSKSLNRVLDKAEVDAIAAGTSYGSAVLEALEGAEIVDAE